MYETTKTGSGALGGWFAAWLVVLAFLAAMPGTTDARHNEGGIGVYYTYGSSTTQYQDINGAYSVPVRTLRPVVGG